MYCHRLKKAVKSAKWATKWTTRSGKTWTKGQLWSLKHSSWPSRLKAKGLTLLCNSKMRKPEMKMMISVHLLKSKFLSQTSKTKTWRKCQTLQQRIQKRLWQHQRKMSRMNISSQICQQRSNGSTTRWSGSQAGARLLSSWLGIGAWSNIERLMIRLSACSAEQRY